MRTFWCKKLEGFFEIYGVSARTRGLSQYGHFSEKGENFLWRLLWMAPFEINDKFSCLFPCFVSFLLSFFFTFYNLSESKEIQMFWKICLEK